jgi:membrane protein YqaA with SNARE-associated domain
MLHRFVEFVQPLAASLGGLGLVLIAFLDSSFLSLPEVPDVLLVWLVIHHPARWPYYASMTTIGSVIGCYAIYVVARKGGEAMIRRRFRARTLDRALQTIRRYGLLAVFVPSLLPPPAPFKIFVILAGISGIPAGSFGTAIVLGRGLRYLIEALLAYRYGELAMRYINENLRPLSLWTAAAIAVIGVGVLLWRRRTRTG